MQMTKKVLSIVLAVMMVVSMMVVGAVSASAASVITTEADLIDAVTNGGSYELGANITMSNEAYIMDDTTIDGKGFTITQTTDKDIFRWTTNPHACLTISDVTLDGNGVAQCAVNTNGTIKDKTNPNWNNSNSDCTVTMTGCTVKNFTGFSYVGAVYMFAYSKGVFNNCTFANNSTPQHTAHPEWEGADIWGGAGTTITINGGSYGDTVFANADSGSASSVAVNDASVAGLTLEAGKNGHNSSATINNSAVVVNCNADDNNAIATDANSGVVVKDSNGDVNATRSSKVITNAAELKEACAAGGNWVLGNDIDDYEMVYSDGGSLYYNWLNIPGDFVLEGNGHKIKVKKTYANAEQTSWYAWGTMFRLSATDATMKVSNLEIDANNVVKWAFNSYDGNGGANYGNYIELNNVEVYNCKSNDYACTVNQFGSATGVYNNCNFHHNTVRTKNVVVNGEAVSEEDAIANSGKDIWIGANGQVTINGGTFEQVFVHSNSASAIAKLDVTGATIDNLNICNCSDNVKITVDATSTVNSVTKYAEGNKVKDGDVVILAQGVSIPDNSLITPEGKLVVASDVMNKENDGNAFGINTTYKNAKLLGVQKKDALPEAEKTSENQDQESGTDLRFIAVINTELVKNADDYGFVVAKAGDSKVTADYAGKFDKLVANWGNGEKTISAKDTYNNVCGNSDYGDPTANTAYKYVTCAVNGMDARDSVIARFFVKIGNKYYYSDYTDLYGNDYTGCVAFYSAL